MNDPAKLAAIGQYAQSILNIIAATDDTSPGPVVPPIVPVPPQPIPPSGDYPTGEDLKRILATLTREFNSNNAAQNGMVGDPKIDLARMFDPNYDPNNQPPSAYSEYLATVANANPLLQAALWLRHGMTLEQVQMQNFVPPQQLNDLVHVMQHYNLLPS